jgi:hypothetical protein
MQNAILLITALAGWLAFVVTWEQLRAANRQLALNVSMAAPKIGTSMKIDKRYENGPNFPMSYYLMASIYNAGQFPAKKLNGKCTLLSATNEVQQRVIPIEWEFLGPLSYDLERCSIEGPTFSASMRNGTHVNFGVNIEFDYLALPDDKPQHYSEQYRYDSKSQQLLRVPKD